MKTKEMRRMFGPLWCVVFEGQVIYRHASKRRCEMWADKRYIPGYYSVVNETVAEQPNAPDQRPGK